MSFGAAIAHGAAQVLVLILSVAFLSGAAVMWGLPQLWHWFKPILQGWLT